jgi:endonuclease/exonuclease/phosphatase family metal-dependent hydrolase
VALQELDVARARTGHVDQARLLAELLEMEHHFHPSFIIEQERYGNAVLSHLPIRLVRAGALPQRGRSEPRGVMWVEVDVAGHRLQCFNTHLGLHARERRFQVKALLGGDWLGHADAAECAILCADLNAPAHSPICEALSERLVAADGPAGTRRSKSTWMRLRQLDHIHISPGLRCLDVRVPKTRLTRVASDHLPLLADLTFRS